MDSVRDIDWSPDGKAFATASADKSIRVWTVQEGIIADQLEERPQTADSGRLGTPEEGTRSRPLNKEEMLAPKVQMLATFTAHSGTVRSVKYHPQVRTF